MALPTGTLGSPGSQPGNVTPGSATFVAPIQASAPSQTSRPLPGGLGTPGSQLGNLSLGSPYSYPVVPLNTDVGRGRDSSSRLRLFSVDAGSGTDSSATPLNLIQIRGTDAGSGTEGSTPRPLGTDTGHGVETTSTFGTIHATDTGAGSDTSRVGSNWPGTPTLFSQLGLAESALGTGDFAFGTGLDPSAPASFGRVGSAWLVMTNTTQARVSQVGLDVAFTVLNPPTRATQVAADALFDVVVPPIRVTQVGADALFQITPPALRITQIGYEAVVFAAPTRFAKAFLPLSHAWTDTGKAYLRLTPNGLAGQFERERICIAYLRLTWPSAGVGLPIPDPPHPPTVTVTHGGPGPWVPPGQYCLGYTWVDPYGETRISPLTCVTVTGSDAGLSITLPDLPPAGATDVRVYITPVDFPGVTPVLITFPAPDSGAPSPDLPAGGLDTITPIVIPAVSIDPAGPLYSTTTPPTLNTTGYSTMALDHDFRDLDSRCAPGTLGWRPVTPKSQIVVVRSGESDLLTIGVAGTQVITTADPLTFPATDSSARAWYALDYDPTALGWSTPAGGFDVVSSDSTQHHTQGQAKYVPHWRGLPTAPVLVDPYLFGNTVIPPAIGQPAGGVDSYGGKATFYRHVWHQPAGTVPEPGLLTLRYTGKLDAVYVNGTALTVNPIWPTRYWQTTEFRVDKSLIQTGKNVLAFQTHTAPASTTPFVLDNGQEANPVEETISGGSVHVPGTGYSVVTMFDGALPNSSLKARRPDGRTRAFWQKSIMQTQGDGFIRGTGGPGFMSWFVSAGSDDGPGFWGYGGDSHQPMFQLFGAWISHNIEGREVTPPGMTARTGTPSPAHWWVQDDGFGVGDKFYVPTQRDPGTGQDSIHTMDPNNPVWANWFAIGETSAFITADRFEMSSVGRLGGGGNVHLQSLDLFSSDEWAPGASWLFTYPLLSGVPGTLERTVYNDIVFVDSGYPIDADPAQYPADYAYPPGTQPWTKGRVVTTVPVSNLHEVFVTVSSRDPSLANLGKARMWVYWLDANEAIGGSLNGSTPSTLWPYSENHFWIPENYASGGDWHAAKAIQIVMFVASDTPAQYNEWLVNVTVREPAPMQSSLNFPQIVG